MATFKVHGADELINSFSKVSGKIPNSVKNEMLVSMGEKLKAGIERTARTIQGPFSQGITKNAITLNKPKLSEEGGSIDVTFKGSRTRGKKGASTRNAEIAFINEFGKRGQPARPFIKTAKENSEAAVTDAGQSILNQWLDEAGL